MVILEVIKCSKVFLVTNRPFKTQYKVVFVLYRYFLFLL
jgi:hypothetical protein